MKLIASQHVFQRDDLPHPPGSRDALVDLVVHNLAEVLDEVTFGDPTRIAGNHVLPMGW